MTLWIFVAISALFGYLMGAIPVGVLVCRLFGVDIQSFGSGRTGTTNAWRAAGLKAAIPTLLGDALKGAIAILIVRTLFHLLFPDPTVMTVEEASTRDNMIRLAESLAGGLAIIGHNWSIFLGFKGGAGGITAATTTMALMPLVGGMVWLIGALLYWWSRIASVATFSVGASALSIFLIMAVNERSSWAYVVYGILAFGAVFIALQSNRDNLKEGKERVISLW